MSALLPRRTRIGYGLGSVATGSFGAVPGLLLLPYLTDTLGVAAGLAGLLVFVPKAWDVVFNPVVGRFSDASTHPDGSRRPFMIRGGLALAVLFAVMLSGPHAPQAVSVVWVVVAYFLCATAYAFFQVPYMALPAEITDDYDERTRLMTWRVAMLALAILVSGGLAPAIRDGIGYPAVGVFVGALIALGVVSAWRGTAGASVSVCERTGGSLSEHLRIAMASRPFRLLLGTWLVQALATGAMLAGVDYVARHVLTDEGTSSILFVCFVGPALLVTPLWQRIAERRDKRVGYLAATCLFLAGAVVTLWGIRAGTAPAAVTLAVVGVGYAGIQMFPMAMLPDVAAHENALRGENRSGVFTGLWTAGETLGLALGPFLFSGVLTLGGYRSSRGEAVEQSRSAVIAIEWGFTLVPAVLVGISLVPLLRYKLARH